VERTLSTLHTVNLGGLELAIEAAKNFRKLRALGFTVHKTIDTVIASGVPAVVVSGEQAPDADLMERSTVPAANAVQLARSGHAL
jgi:hypothetical protein